MAASIVLTGLSANDPVPGSYLEINFAQGNAAGFAGERSILLLGNLLSTGTGTVDSEIYGPDSAVPLQTEADCVSLFGAGSELHRMFRRVTKVNNDSKVYALAVTESAGSKATGAVTLASAATANGNLRIWLNDEFVDTAIVSGDSAATIATAAVANINAQTHWPVTAAVTTTSVVTMTAKQKGLRGNWLRFKSLITSGVTTTATGGVDAFFSGGTTADSNTTALATILAKRYYYIVSAADDATQFGALVSQVNSQAAPTSGIRQRAFCGSVDTLSNTITIATGINAARGEVVWSEKSPWTPAELAANNAAVYAEFELPARPRLNFCSFGNDAKTQAYWKVPASRIATAAPSRTSIKSALNNGITPIASNPNGTTYLVDRITTRSLNGSTSDYRIRDAHKVTVCDFYGDDLLAKIAAQFGGKEIADDPARGARAPGPNVVTPSVFKAAINKLTSEYGENDMLQAVEDTKSNTIAQRETSPATRMAARIPLNPIDIAKQFAVAVDQL